MQEEKNKSRKWIVLGAVAAVLLAGVALGVVGGRLLIHGQNRKISATAGQTVQEQPGEQPEAGRMETSDAGTEAPAETGKVESELEDEEPYTLLVCVPAEYMSLRSTPGLGDDVIDELRAGTRLKWYGEAETVQERDFYKVQVQGSGQEGYVSSEFCVEIEFEADERDLTVVDTGNALYTYDQMTKDIIKLCRTYPDRLRCETAGISLDGRKIYEVTLGDPNAPNHILMQASIHGREYMNTQLVMKLLEYYAFYYDTATFGGVRYRELFEQTAVHIVPMANPDGVSICQFGPDGLNHAEYVNGLYECYERDKWALVCEENTNGDMNWADHYRDRKYDPASNPREITFEEYLTLWKANAAGVDLNKNFDAGWYDLELKQEPSYGDFAGYSPVSEPESALLTDLAYQYDYKCFISYHSMGQLIYCDVVGNRPATSEASCDLAALLYDRIKYKPVNLGKSSKPVLGGYSDWIQLALNKPSVTIESGKKPCPLGIGEFSAIWNRHRESWAMLCRHYYDD